jgi:hypothetical protein
MILTPPLREYRRPGPVVFRGGPPPRYEPPREPEQFRRRRRIQRYLPGQARFIRPRSASGAPYADAVNAQTPRSSGYH